MAPAPAGSRIPGIGDTAPGGGAMVGILFLYGVWAVLALLSLVAVAIMLRD
jgi:hypothetical protein